MEKIQSSSQAPDHGETADRNMILYFGSLTIGTDGNLEPVRTAASLTSNAAVAPAAPAPTPVEDSKKINNQQCHGVEEASAKIQNLPEKSVLGDSSIWGHNFFMTRGTNSTNFLEIAEEFDLDESLKKLQDLKDSQLNLPKPDHQPTPANMFVRESSNRVYYGDDYDSTKMKMSGADASRPLFNLSLLQEILDSGDHEQIRRLLFAFQGSYCSELMTDKSLSLIFQRLINACRGNDLDFVIADLLLFRNFFIHAAFCRIGSSSIIKLIKRVKISAQALSIVEILAPYFYPIMTDEIAKAVIHQCFISFPNLHNQILYEEAIFYCEALATDRVGCRSLNEIISTICGEQRSRLLTTIAYSSSSLSNHHYGNYVVQNVLGLKNNDISARIVLSLRGQFVELGLQQGGSHVVEKCIEASGFGMVSVVKEIVETPEAAFNLARDQFGNYVIQRALKKAKVNGFRYLYESLLKSLKPYSKELNLSLSGKIVLGLMNEEVGVRSKWGRKEWKKEKLVL